MLYENGHAQSTLKLSNPLAFLAFGLGLPIATVLSLDCFSNKRPIQLCRVLMASGNCM